MKIEHNKIYFADSYKLIKDFPPNLIDLAIIDPPYKMDEHGGGGAFGNRNRPYQNDVDTLAYGMRNTMLVELERVMKQTNLYIFCNKNQLHQYLDFYHEYYEDEKNIDLLVWHKTNPVPRCNNKYLSDLEYVLFIRDKGVEVNGSYHTLSKLYQSTTNKDDKENFSHPTIKPLPFVKNMIINSSKKGDVVLDCFSGSGTTCVAAKELGRKFIGIENDERYHKISVDRLNGITANGQTSIFTNFD